VIVVLVVTARKPIFADMRLALLLGLVLTGCASHDASLRAQTYEYGREDRPYTGLPPYLCRPPAPVAPGACDTAAPVSMGPQ
jgi:hypothetical protein